MGHKDLRLGQIVYILVFYNIHFLGFFHRTVSNLFFLLRDSENDLLFSLIAAFSSDTTYSVPGIASHTFMFSFRLVTSLKKRYINEKKNKKLKLFTE